MNNLQGKTPLHKTISHISFLLMGLLVLCGCGDPVGEIFLEASIRENYSHSPKIITTVPTHNQVNIDLNSTIHLTFDREVRLGSENLKLLSPDQHKTLNAELLHIDESKKKISISLKGELFYSKEYILDVPKGAFRYVRNDAVNEPMRLSFSTRLYPPAGISLESALLPGVEHTMIQVDEALIVTFDKNVYLGSNTSLSLEKQTNPNDALSIDLQGETSEPVVITTTDATLQLISNQMMELRLQSPLEKGTKYRWGFPPGALINEDGIVNEPIEILFQTEYPPLLITQQKPLGNEVPVNAKNCACF